jgi:thiol-disulfide isomerase/thioredoxin
MVVITTRCCLNRVDLQHRKSLSSHSDAVSRREQAEARKRKRKQQERSANVALRTAVDFNDLKEQKRRTNPNGEVGLFEQASNSVISWAENLGLIDAHANVKANIRSRFDFDKYVKEGIHRQHNNNDNDILGSSSEKMKISGEREGASTSGGIVVAMFGAPWCKACEAMQNKMLEVYRAHADVTFIRVDAKHNLQVRERKRNEHKVLTRFFFGSCLTNYNAYFLFVSLAFFLSHTNNKLNSSVEISG